MISVSAWSPRVISFQGLSLRKIPSQTPLTPKPNVFYSSTGKGVRRKNHDDGDEMAAAEHHGWREATAQPPRTTAAAAASDAWSGSDQAPWNCQAIHGGPHFI